MNELPQQNDGIAHPAHAVRNWTLTLLGLTTLHHGWGAYIYAAPFRLHIALLAIPLAVLIGWLERSAPPLEHARISGNRRLLTMLLLSGLVILSIGLVEGGYNHALKNVLFFMGTDRATMATLYPAAAYEMPDNFLFETTGALQFLVGLWAGGAMLRLLLPWPSRPSFPSITG
jgi:hypothetical protein